MSDMMFREPNQVKWQGVRPGHNGKQVYWNTSTFAIGELVIVPASATLRRFITYYDMMLNPTGICIAQLRVYTDGDVLVWTFGHIRNIVNGTSGDKTGTFNPPFELPIGWYIVTSLSTGVSLETAILGWEE